MIPALEMSSGTTQCDSLTDAMCDWRTNDYSPARLGCCVDRCDKQGQDVLVCYANEFKDKDLSKCSRTRCPTASPTPSPYYGSTGKNEDDDDGSASLDVAQVAMISVVVLMTSVVVALCTFECRKRALKRALESDQNTDPSEDSDGSVIIDVSDENKP